MKHDKHKAKISARYKKQHGVGLANSNTTSSSRDSNSKNKNPKAHNGGKTQNDGNESTRKTPTSQPEQIITEMQGLGTELDKSRSFSRRKVECNWARYEDFTVEESEDKPTGPRGANFAALIAQSGGASSQLRLKDEKWDEESKPNDKESEIGDIFKVDFREVADCLQAVPLHERLGIPDKYFEKGVLDRIQADAAYHASRVKRIYDEELKSRVVKDNHLMTAVSGTRDCKIQGMSISTTKDTGTIQSKSDTNDSTRSVQIEACPTQSNDVQADEIEKDSKCHDARIASDNVDVCSSPAAVHCMATDELVTDKDRGSSSSATRTTHPAEHTKGEEELSKPQSQNGEEDLEDWLDDFLEKD